MNKKYRHQKYRPRFSFKKNRPWRRMCAAARRAGAVDSAARWSQVCLEVAVLFFGWRCSTSSETNKNHFFFSFLFLFLLLLLLLLSFWLLLLLHFFVHIKWYPRQIRAGMSCRKSQQRFELVGWSQAIIPFVKVGLFHLRSCLTSLQEI